MKIVVDIKGELKKDDVLIFNGAQFEARNKNLIISPLVEENKKLREEIEKMRSEIDTFKAGVNSKLKDYHDNLKILTQEE